VTAPAEEEKGRTIRHRRRIKRKKSPATLAAQAQQGLKGEQREGKKWDRTAPFVTCEKRKSPQSKRNNTSQLPHWGGRRERKAVGF